MREELVTIVERPKQQQQKKNYNYIASRLDDY